MNGRILRAALASWLLAVGPARAEELVVQVLDGAAMPVPDAVVSLVAEADPKAPVPHDGRAAAAVVDQSNETFIPLVTVLRPGGHVAFLNSDTVRHHIYSFSPIKQFQFLLNPGDRSPDLTFDEPGVVAVGCNIHDHMVTYVYVAASPFTALTGADGQAKLTGVPAGTYAARVWHPALTPGQAAPEARVSVGKGAKPVTLTVALVPNARMSPHHSRDY